MNNYKIFKNPFATYEAVKQGWSWPAFFFTIVWTFIKRLLILSIVLILFSMALQAVMITIIQNMPTEETIKTLNTIAIMISLAIHVLLGVYGNQLREKNLLSRGYQLVGQVSAETPQKAIALYINGNSYSQEM